MPCYRSATLLSFIRIAGVLGLGRKRLITDWREMSSCHNQWLLPWHKTGIDVVAGKFRACNLVTSLCLAAWSSLAVAQEVDIQARYSTEKDACAQGPDKQVEIRQGQIVGPGFVCTLLAGRPAGSGLVVYDGTCTIGDKKTTTGPALDLGNYDDHFALSLPNSQTWIKLYPCKSVPRSKMAAVDTISARIIPFDEAAKDKTFVDFRSQLLDAIAKRDVDFVVNQAAEDIKLGFGGNDGRTAFRKNLTLSPDDLAAEYKHEADRRRERYWDALEEVLRLGGKFTGESTFEAPYTRAADLPSDSDPYSTYLVISNNAALRDRPSKYGTLVGLVSYEIVTAIKGGEGTEFVKVKLSTGVQGFLHKDDLRSTVDYHAILRKVDGRWQLSVFVSGD